MSTIALDYLIPDVRLKIGDINPATYRYTDEWITNGLILSVKTLQRYLNYKYLLDSSNEVYRNPNVNSFVFDETTYGVVESADEYLIVLMTAIVMLEGSLENSAWDMVSWTDSEIRFTNLDSGKMRDTNLTRLLNELDSLILPPTKRLARARKLSLPGYKDNPFEYKTEF
jgi:hypothetical protein